MLVIRSCRHHIHTHSNALPLIIVDLYHSVIDPIHIKSIDEIKRERQVQYQVSSAKQLHHDKIINTMGMLRKRICEAWLSKCPKITDTPYVKPRPTKLQSLLSHKLVRELE